MNFLIFNVPQDPNFSYPERLFSTKTIYSDDVNSIRIRTMSLPEFVATRDNFFVAEGWPTIRNTLAATYASDPEGFYLLEKDSEQIGSISVVTYPEIKFAYIGSYVISKEFRGKGYGQLLLSKTIDYATQIFGINAFGLNCIESMQPLYEKNGFKKETIDSFWKFTQPENISQSTTNIQVEVLDQLNDKLLADIIKYDAAIIKSVRANFIENFLNKPGTRVVISVLDNKITGFGVLSGRIPAVKEPKNSYRIGPIYADDQSIARQILSHLLTIMESGESVYLETPDNNQTADMLKEFGFEKVFQQAKMFRGNPPDFIASKIFCYNSIVIGG